MATGVVMLWRDRQPFMVMPTAVTLWYLSMDLAHGMQQQDPHGYFDFMRDVSCHFHISPTCFGFSLPNVRAVFSFAPDLIAQSHSEA